MFFEAIRELVENSVPELSVSTVENLAEGLAATTFKIFTEKAIFFLKVLENEACVLESNALQEAMKVGCAVPEVIFTSEKNAYQGKSFVIIREAPGQLIYTFPQRQRQLFLPELGREIAKIHQIETTGFGKVVSRTNGRFVGEDKVPGQSMYREIAGELNSLRKYLIDDREQARMSEAMLANRSIIASSSSVLNHSDLTMNHIFVNGSAISGIIDFGNLHASDPHHDLAIIHLEWPDDVTSIIKGYQREVDFEFSKSKLSYFTLLACVQRVAWCLDHGMTANGNLKWFRRLVEVSLKGLIHL